MKKVHNDAELFEALMLEASAAGLNRKMIQNKRAAYRKAFANFNPKKVAQYTLRDFNRLMKTGSGIIRNAKKIEAVMDNAHRILEIQKEQGSFDNYIWRFVKGKKLTYGKKENRVIAIAMSKDLKKRGFKFTGPTACYVFMHTVGMIHIPKGTVRKKATELP